jgi:glycosyltransferase involved in cell wall biosynthesis
MPGDAPTISVILPAYRLGDEIHDNVGEVVAALADRAAEVIVVDDGSGDATLAEAHRAAVDFGGDVPVRVLSNPVNLGKGGALRTGTRASVGDVVVFLDGDLDLPPGQVPDLVDRLLESGADVVVGAKHHEHDQGRYPWRRRVLSRLFSFVVRLLFRLPVRETQTGLKVFRRPAIDAVIDDLRVLRYAFDLELLVRIDRAGYSMIEVPVALREGASSAPVDPRMLAEMGRDVLRIFVWSLRPRG